MLCENFTISYIIHYIKKRGGKHLLPKLHHNLFYSDTTGDNFMVFKIF